MATAAVVARGGGTGADLGELLPLLLLLLLDFGVDSREEDCPPMYTWMRRVLNLKGGGRGGPPYQTVPCNVWLVKRGRGGGTPANFQYLVITSSMI